MKTKQIFLLAIFGMYCSSVFAQSAGRTYILTRTYTAHTIKVAPSDPDPSLPTDPTPIRPKPIKPLPIIPEPEPEPEPFPIRPRPINPVLPVNPIPVKPWPIVPDPILPIKPIPIKPDPIVPEPVLPIYPTPFKPDPLVPFPNQPSIVIFDPTITIASLYPDLFPALNNQKSDSLASEYIDVIQYFDRFGCPVETVQKVFTPSGGDLITVQEYDGLFREIKTWLPAVKNTGNGAYVEPSLITDELVGSSLYDGDVRPYSEIRYDASPLNLIVEQHRQGNDWFAQGRSIKTDRISNTGTSGEFACARYEAGGTRTAPTLKKTGYYATGELRVRKTTDEDNNVSYEFKDKADRTILTRRINEGQAHDTYFVYDKYGNPNFVLPPLSSDALTAVNVVWTETAAALKSYAYIYKYDKYNRRIATKLPGCDWTYFVYDKADRLIFSQNGEQRKRSEWTFSIPDAFGRTVLTGTCKNSPNWAADDPLGASAVVKATRTNSTNAFKGYSISGVTLNTPTILTTDWYDDYSFMNFNGIPSSSDVDFKYESVSGYGDQYTGGYKGMLTGSWRALLDGSTNGMFSIMYYDYRGRMIQSKAKNHLGGVDKGYLAYNFTGQTIKMKTAHSATVGGTQQIEEYLYTYDHAGRLTKTALAINGDTTTIAENTYDELGRLKENKKGGNETLKTTYAYNVRSWTKSITGSLFNQTLYYNDSYGGNTKRYGGDVSAMSWKQSNEAQPRGYAFAYDGLSRLTAANYLVNGAASNNYKTSYTYDKHGNLKTLQRYGKTTAANYGIIDNLTSILDGNRITKITDAVTNVFTPESADFKDYSNGAGQYLYDSNGSLTEDTHKGILGISYNVLNLPRELAIKNTIAVGKTYYVYSADGVKLQTKHLFGSDMNYTPIFGSTSGDANLNIVKTTDYVGNRVYENGSLKRVLFDGGYIEGGVFYYYITDHLGNVRVVANSSGTVIQRNHYYPYGMAFAENTIAEQGKQPYKYNGKELDQMHGLNLYDYSARQMEPTLGRFTSMDPMCEKYYDWSPYAYVSNNPMKYVDPTGMFIDWYVNWYKGRIEYIQGNKDLFDQALIHLAADDAKVSEIEDALTEKGYDFEKDPSVEGGYSVDTREQYQGWKMMQVFSPENVATIFFMAGEFGVARGGMKGAGTLGKKITGLFGKEVADASATLFKSFTKSNFRHNLGQLTGNIPANSQAHHVFPQAFQGRFAAKGINIHDPKFGVWWETSSHLKNAKSYNAAWESFFRTNPSPSQILDKGRQLMQQYGIQVGF